jgi:hypothetical protein
MRAAPRCIICLRAVVVNKGTMCLNCCEAYDSYNRRCDGTIVDLIRWVAGRVRRIEKLRERGLV